MDVQDWQSGGFGIYVHWPFCVSKCPYCDFNSHVSANVDHESWAAAYGQEIDRLALETEGRLVRSVYFGGGTPSLMKPQTIGGILDRIHQLWSVSNDLEVTLEANPSSVEISHFQDIRAAGVNRVSLGIQALDDHDLKRLGRAHSLAEARSALEVARSTFTRMNFDLIYARQDQSMDNWKAELSEALAFGADHLSLYQLTIEPGTVFARRATAGKLKGLPTEDLAADMYDLTQQMTDEAGYSAYEVSNHALPGEESRHNLIYWRGGDYLGIGPGAHGRLSHAGARYATEAHASPAQWLKSVMKGGTGELPRSLLSGTDRAIEYLMMGLRVTEGLDLNRLNAMSSEALNQVELESLIQSGLLERSGPTIKTTHQGRLLLNEVIRRLVAD